MLCQLSLRSCFTVALSVAFVDLITIALSLFRYIIYILQCIYKRLQRLPELSTQKHSLHIAASCLPNYLNSTRKTTYLEMLYKKYSFRYSSTCPPSLLNKKTDCKNQPKFNN